MIHATPRRQVSLLVETSNRYGREVVTGVFDFARQRNDWVVHVPEHGRSQFANVWQYAAKCDGVIARVESKSVARRVRSLNRPLVNMCSLGFVPEFVSVVADCEAIGRLAAQHLLERGFTNFGFLGLAEISWSEQREASFKKMTLAAGFECRSFFLQSRAMEEWDRERDALKTWLQSLPRPTAIMAATDAVGQYLLQLCREFGRQIPTDVAVIGVNNDELYCELGEPQMSSIILNGRQAGYEAAALLHALMDGNVIPPTFCKIPPVGVATRQSTDFAAVTDEQVAVAVGYIRQHACDGISVEDVVAVTRLSRSTLERRFRKALNCTLRDQIQQERIKQVQTLLRETNLPLKEIAYHSGFEYPEYLTAVFKRVIGLSPSEYRKRIARRRS